MSRADRKVFPSAAQSRRIANGDRAMFVWVYCGGDPNIEPEALTQWYAWHLTTGNPTADQIARRMA